MDSKFPAWFNHIDLNVLSIASWTNCVLGQLHEGGHSTLLPGKIDPVHVQDFGFAADANQPYQYFTEHAALLTDLWKAQIIKRREVK